MPGPQTGKPGLDMGSGSGFKLLEAAAEVPRGVQVRGGEEERCRTPWAAGGEQGGEGRRERERRQALA